MHNFSARLSGCILLALGLSHSLSAQNPPVLTAEYDNGRTTANNNELLLNPFTVSSDTFGKVGAWTFDGQVIGQPLYVPALKVGKKFLNILYVTTVSNSVYALNADAPGSAPLWQVNLGPNVPLNYAGACPANFSTGPIGILSTPVIDNGSKTLYVVAANAVPNQSVYTHTLYALDLASGQQTHGGSVVLSGSAPGTGTSSVNGTISFGPTTSNLIQRPALLLSKDVVYVGFSGCGPDPAPFHGWVVGYRAGNIQQQAVVYNVTPNGDQGGIWQSGRGLVADKSGSLYFETGNGTIDTTGDVGESFVKISAKGTLQDWFTPPDAQHLSDLDLDLSTSSPILTPDTNLLIGSGKQGLIYVVNAASLGRSNPPLQSFFGGQPCIPIYVGDCQKTHSLAYWNNLGDSLFYVWGTNDFLSAYRYKNGRFQTTPDSQFIYAGYYPGGMLTVTSAAGIPATGILWAMTPGLLRAFSATDVSKQLWNSDGSGSRDTLTPGYHFAQYTVVGGRVYIPNGSNGVTVYGLLPGSTSTLADRLRALMAAVGGS